ncbi:hypothetical protein [Fictibacillus fluitans]|uniref:AP2-like integrase N-terminal domain-containing protein n=1 Tax=Fictibacillus fluitans TaxID=3058422 RepID=A0ABT8HYM5_9BACL|nr:hypothetical protein [Fictibacillus sp. NE201]MDN4525848.1 hypothetical protein [Fictibacillus sp. NE201]
MKEDLRYFFMYKERLAVTNEVIIQFMDFKGKRLVRATAKDLNTTTNQKLKEDARVQWDQIKKADTREQN